MSTHIYIYIYIYMCAYTHTHTHAIEFPGRLAAFGSGGGPEARSREGTPPVFLPVWSVGGMVGWMVGRLVGWLDSWIVGWSDGWIVGWMIGWFAVTHHWLVCNRRRSLRVHP